MFSNIIFQYSFNQLCSAPQVPPSLRGAGSAEEPLPPSRPSSSEVSTAHTRRSVSYNLAPWENSQVGANMLMLLLLLFFYLYYFLLSQTLKFWDWWYFVMFFFFFLFGHSQLRSFCCLILDRSFSHCLFSSWLYYVLGWVLGLVYYSIVSSFLFSELNTTDMIWPTEQLFWHVGWNQQPSLSCNHEDSLQIWGWQESRTQFPQLK